MIHRPAGGVFATRIIAILAMVAGCGSVDGCGRRQPASPPGLHARYTLGPAWQSGGYWFYPTEEASYTATGLAIVDAPRPAGEPTTADGETYDPARAAASHQTLQLPLIVRVRNLETGRQIELRLNDRGPASPGRLISVTPRAALLLGMIPGRPARVSVEEDEVRSRSLLLEVDDAPAGDVVAAPVGAVQEQSLMPRGDIPDAARMLSVRQVAAAPRPGQVAAAPRPGDKAAALDETITSTPIEPGRLWIDAGHFSQPGYARRLAIRLSGAVRQEGQGRSSVFRVRVGPFNLPAEADAALDQARSAGVTGARIIVE